MHNKKFGKIHTKQFLPLKRRMDSERAMLSFWCTFSP